MSMYLEKIFNSWNDERKSVFCKICVKAKNTGSTFGFMKGGKSGNIQRSDFYGIAGHLTSQAHKKALGTSANQTRVTQMLVNEQAAQRKRLVEQENVDFKIWSTYSVLLSYYLAKNNLPYNQMDDLFWLVQNIVELSTGFKFEKKVGSYGSYSTNQSAKEIAISIASEMS